jgi:hypothetical protein
MAGFLTIDQIVAEGLDLGGNPGITTRATTYLKYLLHTLYRTDDWEFLLKSATALSDVGDFGKISAAALPADYRAIRQLHIAPDPMPLQQVPFEDLSVMRNNDAATGSSASGSKPRLFAIDNGGGSKGDFYVYPKPDTRYTFNLRYYRLPDVTAYTGATIPEFDDSAALVMAVAHFAQSYDQNTFQELMRQEARAIANSYRLSHRDIGRAAVEILPFSEHHFRKPFRDA